MRCPKCAFEQPDDGGETCVRCGLVFAKHKPEALRRALRRTARASRPTPADFLPEGWPRRMWNLALSGRARVTPVSFAGRSLLYAILVVWGGCFVFSPLDEGAAGQSVLHLLNLPFHEFGHILFMPFGEFLRTLGGSLTQLLVPLVCLVAFLVETRDAFAASVALWWLSESAMDLAPYIGDARARELVLLGGVTGRDVEGYHDWEAILGTLGLLEYDQFLGRLAQAAGIGAMVLSLAWGGWMLRLELARFRSGGWGRTPGNAGEKRTPARTLTRWPGRG